MENQTHPVRTFGKWFKESLFVKLLVIGFLVLILMIPNAMISDLIRERAGRQQQVNREVSQSWGQEQTLIGPVLTIPYNTTVRYDNDVRVEKKEYAHFLPQQLNITGDLNHELRQKSIFDVILYRADVQLNGTFSAPDFAALNINENDVLWDQARLSMGLTDMTGIREAVELRIGERSERMEPGTADPRILPKGVNSALAGEIAQTGFQFDIPLSFAGSYFLYVEPVGKTTAVKLSSDWHSPGFEGAFLPIEREISDAGFIADWKVLDVNRSYPQQWTEDTYRFRNVRTRPAYSGTYAYAEMEAAQSVGEAAGAAFGVRFVQPVDGYLKTTRSAKYAILVIGLTFLIFFFFETLKRVFVHPFQYLLIGLALTVFYLLLLSISEHLGFNPAYFIAALATIGLIGGYSYSVLDNNRPLVGQLVALLIAIYLFIFVVLQLEDYALLAGSIGIFVALAAVMWGSRKVDWRNLRGS